MTIEEFAQMGEGLSFVVAAVALVYALVDRKKIERSCGSQELAAPLSLQIH
jgi:hypothetical protein